VVDFSPTVKIQREILTHHPLKKKINIAVKGMPPNP
jgi:hypothetical protein